MPCAFERNNTPRTHLNPLSPTDDVVKEVGKTPEMVEKATEDVSMIAEEVGQIVEEIRQTTREYEEHSNKLAFFLSKVGSLFLWKLIWNERVKRSIHKSAFLFTQKYFLIAHPSISLVRQWELGQKMARFGSILALNRIEPNQNSLGHPKTEPNRPKNRQEKSNRTESHQFMVAQFGFGLKTKPIRPKESTQNKKKIKQMAHRNRTELICTKPNWIYDQRKSNRTETKKSCASPKISVGLVWLGSGRVSPVGVNFHHYFSFISHWVPLPPPITWRVSNGQAFSGWAKIYYIYPENIFYKIII